MTVVQILIFQFSLAWAVFLLFHTNFSILMHTVSICLTLSLAIWRFIMIKFPGNAVTLCTLVHCKVVLFCGYGETQLLSIKKLVFWQSSKRV